MMVQLVERFGTLFICRGGKTERDREFHFTCPFCGAPGGFESYAPSHCATCQNALPEFNRLKNSVIYRMMWHFEDEIDGMIAVL